MITFLMIAVIAMVTISVWAVYIFRRDERRFQQQMAELDVIENRLRSTIMSLTSMSYTLENIRRDLTHTESTPTGLEWIDDEL